MEIWKDIIGYEGLYQVSDLGRIKSLKRKKILKPVDHTEKYNRVFLSKKGKVKPFFIHRLIATAFIPNPENKRTINHINGIRNDNRIENLEWNTYSENGKHSYHSLGRIHGMKGKLFGLHHGSISIYKIKDGIVLGKYDSIKRAALENNFCYSNICQCVRGEQKTAHGYNWKRA